MFTPGPAPPRSSSTMSKSARLLGMHPFSQPIVPTPWSIPATPVPDLAQAILLADPGRPVIADVWDGLMPYSRSLNMVGVHRWPLMTTLELPQYREWLDQRRRLANPNTFMWTWIQTHMPDWYTN